MCSVHCAYHNTHTWSVNTSAQDNRTPPSSTNRASYAVFGAKNTSHMSVSDVVRGLAQSLRALSRASRHPRQFRMEVSHFAPVGETSETAQSRQQSARTHRAEVNSISAEFTQIAQSMSSGFRDSSNSNSSSNSMGRLNIENSALNLPLPTNFGLMWHVLHFAVEAGDPEKLLVVGKKLSAVLSVLLECSSMPPLTFPRQIYHYISIHGAFPLIQAVEQVEVACADGGGGNGLREKFTQAQTLSQYSRNISFLSILLFKYIAQCSRSGDAIEPKWLSGLYKTATVHDLLFFEPLNRECRPIDVAVWGGHLASLSCLNDLLKRAQQCCRDRGAVAAEDDKQVSVETRNSGPLTEPFVSWSHLQYAVIRSAPEIAVFLLNEIASSHDRSDLSLLISSPISQFDAGDFKTGRGASIMHLVCRRKNSNAHADNQHQLSHATGTVFGTAASAASGEIQETPADKLQSGQIGQLELLLLLILDLGGDYKQSDSLGVSPLQSCIALGQGSLCRLLMSQATRKYRSSSTHIGVGIDEKNVYKNIFQQEADEADEADLQSGRLGTESKVKTTIVSPENDSSALVTSEPKVDVDSDSYGLNSPMKSTHRGVHNLFNRELLAVRKIAFAVRVFLLRRYRNADFNNTKQEQCKK